MKVFKFGGASVSTVERIMNVAAILQSYQEEPLLVVISAMGKTTNALEKVVAAFYAREKDQALELFQVIKQQHFEIAASLQEKAGHPGGETNITYLSDFFTEVEWLLHDKPVRDYDYYYDQVVCIGELLSTAIVSHYLNVIGLSNALIDVRDIIRTDNAFRDARINWKVTEEKVHERILPLFQLNQMVITQGFIGSTDENESTTLGREGSDYTAAVFANLLNAKELTIWKDVQGVMNADPKLYAAATWIPDLNYQEVIEMAYYGAQVIHPNTIKPLQNKNIPLQVRSFIHPGDAGTCIHNQKIRHLPPIIVYKNNQVLVEMKSKDYSFVSEGLTAAVYQIFESLKFKPNLTQSAAISVLCVVDEHPEKVEELALQATTHFEVTLKRNLHLLTIRHYNEQVLEELIKDATIVLKQQTPETIQVLIDHVK